MSEPREHDHGRSARIVADDIFIASDTPDIRLHLRHKRGADMGPPSAANTVLLMHAATYAGETLYDLPLTAPDGTRRSFMDFLAARGFQVYALDVRGYGRSTRPPAMDADPSRHAPVVATETAVRDFDTAMSWICDAHDIAQLNVFAMSWGGTVAGRFAASDDCRVRRLALVAPQWLTAHPTPLDSGGELGAFRHIGFEPAAQRWLGAAPEYRQAELASAVIVRQWFDAHLATEPCAALRESGRVRVPNGAIQDKRDYWSAGRPLYDPARISAPVLLVHGEWDRDVPLDTTKAFFETMTGSVNKQWLELGASSHMLMLERRHQAAFDAISRFFQQEN